MENIRRIFMSSRAHPLFNNIGWTHSYSESNFLDNNQLPHVDYLDSLNPLLRWTKCHCLIISFMNPHMKKNQMPPFDFSMFIKLLPKIFWSSNWNLNFKLQVITKGLDTLRQEHVTSSPPNNSKELQRDDLFEVSNLQLRRSSYLKLMCHFTNQESDVEPNVTALCYNI